LQAGDSNFFSFFLELFILEKKHPVLQVGFISLDIAIAFWENVRLRRLQKYSKKKMEIHLSFCIAQKQLLSTLWSEFGNRTWWVINNSRKWMFAERIIITGIQNFIDCPLFFYVILNDKNLPRLSLFSLDIS